MENYEILKQKYAYTNKLFHEIDTKIGNGAEIIKERELRDQSLELLKKNAEYHKAEWIIRMMRNW